MRIPSKRKLIELASNCKSMLNAKKLQETEFSDIIQPYIDLLDQVRAAKENNELDLPPLDDDKVDISKVLNTKEDNLDADGTVNEAYYKKHSRSLQEKDRSYQAIVNAYKEQGGTADFEEWKSWIATQPDKLKAQLVNRYNFNRMYGESGVDVGTNAEEGSNPEIPAEPYTPTENLQNLIDMCDAGEDFVETALTTVTDKYDTIELLLRRVIRGKSPKRYYLLAGDPGIGKTYEVNKLLKADGILDSTPVCTGSIGRSVTSIATFLWQYKDTDLVVLDDCDSFLKKGGSPDVVNILKGCMEAGTGYKVGIPISIANRVTKELKKASKDESKVPEKIKALFEDDEDEEEDLSAEDNDETYIDTEDAVPTSWKFNARLVILSNLHESQIEDALWSRCDHFDLHLTQEEYLIRLAMIIDDMDVGQKDGIFTEEEAKEAKALTLSVMRSVIEAGNHGVKLFGKFVKLTDHLEFRVVKDLCNMWLAMLDRELELHPDESRDTAKKNILKKWVRVGVIPRLSATTKL